MGLFWLIVGAAIVVLAYLFNRSFEKQDRRPAWYDWVAYVVLCGYWSLVFYFVLMSLAEHQAKPAGVGFAVFGGIGLLLVLGYRLLLTSRFKQA